MTGVEVTGVSGEAYTLADVASEMELVYRGAIDDEVRDVRAVENHYPMDAMTATAEGQPIDQAVTKSIGCTIKWAN